MATRPAKKTAEKPFDKQTKAEQRVTIARDVLKQLAAKHLVAKPGTYVEAGRGMIVPKGTSARTELRDILRKKKQCQVCALGSLFVAGVERADGLRVGDIWEVFGTSKVEYGVDELTRQTCTNYLDFYFEAEQLDLIEDVFELAGNVSEHFFGFEFDEETGDAIIQPPDPSERLRLIMENIVANGGTFNPNARPVATAYTTPGFKG